MKNTTKKLAIGTMIAAGAGYLAGILTAPKSGKDTRKDIKDTAERSITAAEKQLKQLHSQLSDVITKSKNQISKLSGKTKKDLQATIDKAVVAKEKAREILSAVHEGEPQDKNLAKALSEAQKAISSLKEFLK